MTKYTTMTYDDVLSRTTTIRRHYDDDDDDDMGGQTGHNVKESTRSNYFQRVEFCAQRVDKINQSMELFFQRVG